MNFDHVRPDTGPGLEILETDSTPERPVFGVRGQMLLKRCTEGEWPAAKMADKLLLLRVPGHVLVEMRSASKIFAAGGTTVRSSQLVNSPLVLVFRGSIGKTLVTVGALERPFASVRPRVLFQIEQLGEHLAAGCAGVLCSIGSRSPRMNDCRRGPNWNSYSC